MTQGARRSWIFLAAVLLLGLFFFWKSPPQVAPVSFLDGIRDGVGAAGIRLCGFGDVEKHDNALSYRWGMGPDAVLEFQDVKARPAELHLTCYSPLVPDQTAVVFINGRQAGEMKVPGKHASTQDALGVSIPFTTRKGRNTVLFAFGDWNGRVMSYAGGDGRRFALQFLRLQIQATR